MSVVVNIMARDFTIVGYDGRANKDGIVVSENTIKAHKLNSNVCLGYTGTLELAERFIDVIFSEENRFAIKYAHCEDVLNFIVRNIERADFPSQLTIQFLITGLSRTGSFCTMAIKPGEQPKTTFAKKGELFYAVLSTNKPEEYNLNLRDFICREIAKPVKADVAYKASIRHFIEAIADIDKTVNRNVRFIQLTR